MSREWYISSGVVYSHTLFEPITEDHPVTPTTIYGAAKIFSELCGLSYYKNYGLDFVTLRFSVIYGPRRRIGPSLYREIFENAVQGKPTILPYGADHKFDWVYVKDCAEAVVLTCYAKELKHRIFNVAGKQLALGELASVIRKFIPGAIIELGPGVISGKPIIGGYDTSRVKEELKFKPQYSFEDGVKDYLKWLQTH